MGPSGPLTLLLLLIAFAGGAWGIAHVRPWPLALAPAAGAFLAAGLFGVSAVNAYYGYYQSWSDLVTDLRADNGLTATAVSLPLALGTAQTPPTTAGTASDRRPWRVERIAFPGLLSGVQGRSATVLLPPGRHGRLPVLVLMHGEPGAPESWISGLHLAAVLQREAAASRIAPMVVVLPDVRGRRDQQCLDEPGLNLGTYLSQDLPADITSLLPVDPPGRHWVLGGLSAGGSCAANLALHRPDLYAGAALLDGYFRPELPARVVRAAFHGDAAAARADDPTALVMAVPPARPLPRFWLMAGTGNASDYRAAVGFGLLLSRHEDVRLLTVLGGSHTTPAWRVALPDLLQWSSATLAGHPYAGSTSVPG